MKQGKIILADQEIPYDTLLVATGRKPNIEVAQRSEPKNGCSNKFVAVNDFYETSKKHVYAVGDLIGGYQLAHAASAEGLIAVHAMNGDKPQAPRSDRNSTMRLYTSGNRFIWAK